MIAIIDYGMGNLRSVQKALEEVGAKTIVTQKSEDIQKADKVVLPGVGHMRSAIDKLQDLKLFPTIKNVINSKKPFLGICLGMQLLFEKSEESGSLPALNTFKGIVEKLPTHKVPHMGWNQIQLNERKCILFEDIKDLSNFYFCHSYYANTSDTSIIVATTNYENQNFTCAVTRGNLFGVQFHPEKSQTVGLKILKNFVEMPS